MLKVLHKKNLSELSQFISLNHAIYVSLGLKTYQHIQTIISHSTNVPTYYFTDGVFAVYIERIKRFTNYTKLPGCDLWLEILNNNRFSKIVLIGGSEIVLEKTLCKLQKEFPLIKVVHAQDGYGLFDCENLGKIFSTKKPDFIFVATGQPRQEIQCAKLFEKYPNASYLPIGGSFDVYSGVLKRSPKLLIKLNLEWLYRIMSKPDIWFNFKELLLCVLNVKSIFIK